MKSLMKIFAALLLAGGSLVSVSASATAICNGCGATTADDIIVYIGVHNPTTDDQSNGLFHNGMDTSGAFTDYWVFDISPTGLSTLNMIFNPLGDVANFKIELFAVAAGSNCPTLGATCTGVSTTGAAIGTGTGAGAANINFVGPLLGRYALVVTGTVTDGQGSQGYSGNVTTFQQTVPEPGTLILLGLGLAGLGLVRRRSQ